MKTPIRTKETEETEPEKNEKPPQKTVQTGQSGQDDTFWTDKVRAPGKGPFFEVAQDDDLSWHWLYWSSNGRALATNAMPYKCQPDCVQAIKTLCRSVGAAPPKIQLCT